MSDILNKHGLVKRFMTESRYTNDTHYYGVKKTRKNPKLWNYAPPDVMLKDFLRWLRTDGVETKERNLGYRQIGHWVEVYQLEDDGISASVEAHYNSKLTPAHALIIYRLNGAVSISQISRAFDISHKSIRDIWDGIGWKKLIRKYEQSIK